MCRRNYIRRPQMPRGNLKHNMPDDTSGAAGACV
jgi:hypothetical protein